MTRFLSPAEVRSWSVASRSGSTSLPDVPDGYEVQQFEPGYRGDAPLASGLADEHRFDERYLTGESNGGLGEPEFQSIGYLAAALGLQADTIRHWIARGVIPDAGWRTPPIDGTLGSAGRRLWTSPQVQALVRIATEEGVLGAKRAKLGRTNFSGRVWSLWGQNDW